MRTTWLAALAVAADLAACTPPAPPPPPANAEALPEPGPYDQRLDDVTQELRDALEPHYGRLAVAAYRFSLPGGWPSISAYYQNALSKWEREPALPENIRAAHARAWKRYGAVFAVAVIDTPVPGEGHDYKILVVATK